MTADGTNRPAEEHVCRVDENGTELCECSQHPTPAEEGKVERAKKLFKEGYEKEDRQRDKDLEERLTNSLKNAYAIDDVFSHKMTGENVGCSSCEGQGECKVCVHPTTEGEGAMTMRERLGKDEGLWNLFRILRRHPQIIGPFCSFCKIPDFCVNSHIDQYKKNNDEFIIRGIEYVRSLLLSERQRVAQALVGELPEEEIDAAYQDGSDFERGAAYGYTDGWNAARSALIEKAKGMGIEIK